MLNNEQGHILFIEENEELAAIVKAYCEAYELGCTTFSHTTEALENFKTNQTKYQLIVTDVSLNGNENGIALANGLKHLNRQKRMPAILAITKNIDEQNRASILNAGVNDVIGLTNNIKSIASLANSLITNKRLLDKVDEQKEELNSLTLTDSLTGLYNKHYLIDQASKFIPLAKRQQFPLSLITVEIHGFQEIIDTYGHQSSDLVLQCIGILIKSTSRSEDISARFSAHEFVTLLPYCSLEGAKNKAIRLQQAIQKLNPDNIKVSAKICVSNVPLETPCNWDRLIKEGNELA